MNHVDINMSEIYLSIVNRTIHYISLNKWRDSYYLKVELTHQNLLYFWEKINVIIRINVKQLLKLFFTIIAYYFIILYKSHPFLLSIITLLFTCFDNLISRMPAAYHWSQVIIFIWACPDMFQLLLS